ncbi:MAG: SMP-30/gluconolactonase/LRE family protein [Bryobacterales bacterium]|nr:SMP-30/gluconolactonase/LRE family protein [Bryobacterales bacterium]
MGDRRISRRGFLAAALASPAFGQPAILSNLEKLADFGVHEGPAWHFDLGLLCTGNGNIFRYAKDGKISVFRQQAGRPNGLLIDPQGRLIVCEQGERRVTRTERDGSITVLAGRFQQARFNSPNDLAIDSKGRIYFSDPRYGPREGMELKEAVYRIDAPGVVSRVLEQEIDRPNGLLVSPNDQFLYVADNNNTAGGPRKLWRFHLHNDGSVDPGSKKLIFDWGDARGPDGMKMDRAGRLFVAGGLNKPHPPHETADRLKGGIYVLSPQGKLLQFLAVPLDEVTNCAFGGADGKSLYITAGGALFRAQASDPGWIPGRFA